MENTVQKLLQCIKLCLDLLQKLGQFGNSQSVIRVLHIVLLDERMTVCLFVLLYICMFYSGYM